MYLLYLYTIVKQSPILTLPECVSSLYKEYYPKTTHAVKMDK